MAESEHVLPRDGACLSLGRLQIGRFPDSCSECSEIASYRWSGATFNSGEWYFCHRHAVLNFLQLAEEADQDALFETIEAHGWVRPDGYAPLGEARAG